MTREHHAVDAVRDDHVDDEEVHDVRGPLLTNTAALQSQIDAQEEGRGGFFSSSFTVFNSTVGTGILTLPYSFKMMGATLGLSTLVAYAVIMSCSAYAVVRCASKMNCKTFQEIVRKVLGDKAGIAMSITIAFYCYLVCVGCLVIVADVSNPMLKHWSDGEDTWYTHRAVAIAAGAVLALPPMSLTDFTSLTFTALLSFAAIVYVVVIVIAHGYDKVTGDLYDYNATEHIVQPPLDGSGDVDWGPTHGYKILYAIPNIALSLQCHIQAPGIFSELPVAKRTPEYFSGVLVFSYLLCIVLYSSCAFFGYVTFREHTPPNIMQAGYNESEASTIIARICLVVTSVCALPINHHPCRAALKDLYTRWRGSAARVVDVESVADSATEPGVPKRRKSLADSSVKSHVTFDQELQRDGFYWVELLGVWSTMTGLAIIVPNLSVLNAIIGFTAGVSVMFIFPGLFLLAIDPFYEQLLATKPTLYRGCGYFFVTFGVLTGMVACFSFIAALV